MSHSETHHACQMLEAEGLCHTDVLCPLRIILPLHLRTPTLAEVIFACANPAPRRTPRKGRLSLSLSDAPAHTHTHTHINEREGDARSPCEDIDARPTPREELLEAAGAIGGDDPRAEKAPRPSEAASRADAGCEGQPRAGRGGMKGGFKGQPNADGAEHDEVTSPLPPAPTTSYVRSTLTPLPRDLEPRGAQR